MRFAHFFVDRPIFASVTSIIFLLLGVWLFRAISRDVQPLVALEHAMETRDARDLTPVPANASTLW